ncbi:protein LATE ELONGATED HYPOCOTYL isoform X2 [Cornus florida]|uniref:protein LATE ELONGATED HYPOCOTYL isoform X2 n=1 Tax=Cornus florida TaxID=4283 RepID=UPI0028A27EE6|nr:protein LATE ELONGATED HYPOCOTYL isoform X2 [Cornus florida]
MKWNPTLLFTGMIIKPGSKLEKEALVKGVPIGQALDINIPPPRPKRKPSNPYPRKTGVGAPTPQVGVQDGKLSTSGSSLCSGKQILDLEKEPLPEKPNGDEKPGNAKENHDEGNCFEVFTISQESPCTPLSSANKTSMPPPVAPRISCTFKEFVPLTKEVVSQDETAESYITAESRGNQSKLDTKQTDHDNGRSKTSNLGNSKPLHEKLIQGKKTNEQCQTETSSALLNDMQATQNYPRHVPVHVLDGNLGMSTQHVSCDMSYQDSIFHQMEGVHGQLNLFSKPAVSATTEHHNTSRSSIHQSFPAFHPHFTPISNNQDDYQSFLHTSSAFSSLVVSTLLQNPAAFAAASFAATFLPSANMETSADSLAGSTGCFPSRQLNPAPSMAAIAAATVAAAISWWAAHGLLPLCPPLYTGFSCTPPATAAPADTGPAATANSERRENSPNETPFQDQQPDLENSGALQEQLSASKSLTSSSSGSEENEGAKLNTEITSADHDKVVAMTELHDSNKANGSKRVDRSSCGSNTSSSSELETDALEKNEKANEEPKEPDVSHTASDSNNRRGRCSIPSNDSWKEVSEEGRQAFRALFSRTVLPQSFSPPHDLKNKGYQNNTGNVVQITDGRVEDGSRLDLNIKTWVTCSSPLGVEKILFMRDENNGEEGLLTMGLGHGKLKARRTGFKPYKRCSVEAKESKVASVSNQGEEQCPKRIRLEGEAST